MLRSELHKAAADKDSDWVQFTVPSGDFYYLRRRGLINILREMKGLDWEAAVSGAHLVFTWPSGSLAVKLDGFMNGDKPYPVACGRSQKGGEGVRYRKKHNYLAHEVRL